MEIDIDELKNVRNSSNNLKSKEDNDVDVDKLKPVFVNLKKQK